MLNNDIKNCPFCGGVIKVKAIRCKHCRADLPSSAKEYFTKEPTLSVEEANIKDTKSEKKMNYRVTPEEDIRIGNKITNNKQESQSFIGTDLVTESDLESSSGDIGKNSQVNKKTKEENEQAFGKINEILKYIAGISYALSVIFVGLGFHKMFAYYNPSSSFGTTVNAYVGGDAYNYIINANYATAYYALAIFCAIVGGTAILGMVINRGITDKKRQQLF